MTFLKQIIFCVLVLLVVVFSAKAQTTGLHPYEGATHTYAWNGLQEGVGYEFYITADASGSMIYEDVATGEFDFLYNSESGTVGKGESTAAAQILWNMGASQHTYYLWLKVTASSGCSNYRYVEVVPQVNDFDLLSENVPVTNTRSCPSTNTDDGFNALASEYDAGFTTLQFLVRRENGTRDWSFVPSLVVNPDLNLGKFIISVTGDNSGTIAADYDNRYTVLGTDSEVNVTVTIENAPGYTRAVTLQITGQREEQTNLPDGDSSNDNVTHTIEVIPLIGGMGGV